MTTYDPTYDSALNVAPRYRLRLVGRVGLLTLLVLGAFEGSGAPAWTFGGQPVSFVLLVLLFYALLWRCPRCVGPPGAVHLLVDVGVLALAVKLTGGSTSPILGLAYLWFFGVLVLYPPRWSRRAPLLVASSLLGALGVGMWGSPDWLAALGVHAVGATVASVLGLRLLGERLESRCDPLTQSLHRRAGLEGLQAWAARGEPFTLVFLDLRGFKGVNDRYGHTVGDEVLRAVADRLGGVLRRSDLLIRYGGDEFVVAGRGVQGLKGRLADALAASLRTSVGPLQVGVDLGEVAKQPGESVADLLTRADAAMYRAKARAYAAPSRRLGWPDPAEGLGAAQWPEREAARPVSQAPFAADPSPLRHTARAR